jgi:hypothetical protein
MVTAVVIVTLLTVAASLASWLFGQWLARRTRVSGAALAVGGGGAVLLIASVAVVIVTASSWWQQLLPVQDFGPLTDSAAKAAGSTDDWPAKAAPPPIVEPQSPIAEAQPAASAGYDDPPVIAAQLPANATKAELLAAAETHLKQSEYGQAVDIARQYLAANPDDNDMRSMLARSLFAAQHPGPAQVIPAAVVAEWPATDCVDSTRADDSSRWILDNGCGRVVAVLFASCQLNEIACFTNTLVPQGGWSYEPSGILMTAANDRPVALRLGDAGPLVAPIFTIRDDAGRRRQIRYLACDVTAPRVLQLLRDSGGDLTPQRLLAELRADACYSQVLDWSRSGHRLGASPDALLRLGIH